MNTLKAELGFHILVRAMLRRISGLMEAYVVGEPDLDYKGLVDKAASVKIKTNNLKWADWKRYSSRQDQKMFMGGLVGDVTYEGDLAEFIPLLETSVHLHLGKQTAFGLRMIQLDAAESFSHR